MMLVGPARRAVAVGVVFYELLDGVYEVVADDIFLVCGVYYRDKVDRRYGAHLWAALRLEHSP